MVEKRSIVQHFSSDRASLPLPLQHSVVYFVGKYNSCKMAANISTLAKTSGNNPPPPPPEGYCQTGEEGNEGRGEKGEALGMLERFLLFYPTFLVLALSPPAWRCLCLYGVDTSLYTEYRVSLLECVFGILTVVWLLWTLKSTNNKIYFLFFALFRPTLVQKMALWRRM